MANLCQILRSQQVSLEDLFWALVDIDHRHYETYAVDWVSCYLTALGVYKEEYWFELQANHFYDLQHNMCAEQGERLQLMVVPTKNIAYRSDLGNHVHQSARHVLLIHQNEPQLLEDLAIGVTGDAYAATPLHARQFVFPLTYWIFDTVTFVKRLFSIDLQQKTKEYANRLLDHYPQIQTLKRQLLVKTVQENDLKKLVSTYLYEESYYYRTFFMSRYATNSDIGAHHEQYKQVLSKFKGLFLRMQNCSISQDLQRLQYKAIDQINHLSELDHEFYRTFATYL